MLHSLARHTPRRANSDYIVTFLVLADENVQNTARTTSRITHFLSLEEGSSPGYPCVSTSSCRIWSPQICLACPTFSFRAVEIKLYLRKLLNKVQMKHVVSVN